MKLTKRMRAPALTVGALILINAPVSSAQGPERFWRIEFDASHFTGDYGLQEEVSLDVLTTRLRYRSGRSEIRLSLPFIRLDGAATLVGGTPSGGPPGSPGPPGPQPASPTTSESGPGDVSLRFDYDLLQGGERKPWLTGLLRAKLPTADEEAGLGTGETDLEAGLLFTQPFAAYMLLLEGRVTKMGDPEGIDFDDVGMGSIGLARKFGERGLGTAYVFLEHRTHPVEGLEARRSVSTGATWRVGSHRRTRITTAVFAGLTSTAEDWGIQLVVGRQL